MMINKTLKLTYTRTLLMVVVGVFLLPAFASAWYEDDETSRENQFTAGKLDMVLSLQQFDGTLSNDPGDEVQFDVNASILDGSLYSQHNIAYEFVGGSMTTCSMLNISAGRGAVSYSGTLPLLNAGPTTNFGIWNFLVEKASGSSLTTGTTCEFDIVFTAWRKAVTTPQDSGYVDEERLRVRIEIDEEGPQVVINEFLPNPDGILCEDGSSDCSEGDSDFIYDFGKDSDDKPKGEWVELFNRTNQPVDLSGWYVSDASGGAGNTVITAADTASGTTTIPANGYLVLYMNKPVWNNTGDTVKLFNSTNQLQDSYAYTSDYDYCILIPTAGSTNDDMVGAGSSNCTPGSTVPGNKSYARIPDGFGSFVDPIPTPGAVNTDDMSPKSFASSLDFKAKEDEPKPQVEGDSTKRESDKDKTKGDSKTKENDDKEIDSDETETDNNEKETKDDEDVENDGTKDDVEDPKVSSEPAKEEDEDEEKEDKKTNEQSDDDTDSVETDKVEEANREEKEDKVAETEETKEKSESDQTDSEQKTTKDKEEAKNNDEDDEVEETTDSKEDSSEPTKDPDTSNSDAE